MLLRWRLDLLVGGLIQLWWTSRPSCLASQSDWLAPCVEGSLGRSVPAGYIGSKVGVVGGVLAFELHVLAVLVVLVLGPGPLVRVDSPCSGVRSRNCTFDYGRCLEGSRTSVVVGIWEYRGV